MKLLYNQIGVKVNNYILQLTGLGGLSPNTVMMNWPRGWNELLHNSKPKK
jgi:hypothetical protein